MRLGDRVPCGSGLGVRLKGSKAQHSLNIVNHTFELRSLEGVHLHCDLLLPPHSGPYAQGFCGGCYEGHVDRRINGHSV